jgi:arylsulfatase A-like enzyme
MAGVTKPNIVFVLCDNVGWGDFGVYGGGTPTPRIDQLANEGIRLNNYVVESQCTPTRSAIMTGRQSVRSGTFRVPFSGEGKAGLAPWEYTIAELLSDAGYATSLFGKWHCGDTEGRLPTDQGFDEWWGYRRLDVLRDVRRDRQGHRDPAAPTLGGQEGRHPDRGA